ncbi:acetaldehyde dehydrogenase [Klebsiella pneumoniae]|uniref:Acetaldehyde dehydrogenase n=1 Tax=Klebsiella pneumoniae TaxID=573 RepID=A0A378AH08_KLEPN|nr:acetaldehyde dehydrogenase [Klebsiella pneumoniae]
MNQQDIEQVVKAVLLKMKDSSQPAGTVHDMGVFASLDDAVAAATVAQPGLKRVAMRQQVIQAIREAGEKYARELAELAVTETGMGRVEDKFAKNVAQARGTPGVECLTPQVLTGDNGLTLIENAPWGVVASVTPSTNPAATVINNAISLIAAGNSVVFAPHPAAKKVSQRAITLLNQAVVAAGGPANLLVTVANPDIDTAQRLFKYPGIGLLVVTGGEAVVEAARKHTNKRLIAAGAGNPPVVVDETADLPRAAQAIVKGASFDNNIICADEKVLIVVDSVADELMRLMEGQQAVKLTAAQAEQLQPLLLKNIDERGKGTVSRDWVGRDAGKIAAAIGLQVPAQTRLLFVETPASHPFAVTELMMPVLPVVRVANVEEAIALAVATGRRLPPHRGDALPQHRQHEPDGERHRHQHLRQKWTVHRRAWAGRRGLDHHDHHHPNRGRGDQRAHLRSSAPLRAGGCVSNRIRDEHGARRTTLAFAETTKSRCPV